MRGFKDLIVYQKAFELSMDIFETTKSFPKEEIYSLTDQIRRSSRSVCANLAEAYRKRSYIKHFLSKITDCQMENSETEVWLDFSLECKYITEKTYTRLLALNDEVGKLLYHIYSNPNKYGTTE